MVVVTRNKFRRTSFPRPSRRAAHHVGPALSLDRSTRDPPGFARTGQRARAQIRALCNKHLDEMVGREFVDGGTDYAQFIPPGVIATMLGFPSEDEEIFRDIVHLVLDLIDLPTEVRGPLFEPMGEYFAKQIDDHIENPRDDLTSYLLNVEVGGNKLERQHVAGTMVLILVAGIDTTWSAIGSAIWHSPSIPMISRD